MSEFVVIEHVATIFHADGSRCSVGPCDDSELGLFKITYDDGDGEKTFVMHPEMALALSSTITRIVSLNAKAPR